MRTRLVQARKDELGKDTQREIVGKACGPHTSADEVKQLSGLGLFTDRELFQFSMSAHEQIQTTLKQTQTKFETMERAHTKEQRASAAWQVCSLDCQTKSKTTGIATGHEGATCGGAVFDDARHIIVSTSYGANWCRDVFVTQLSDATHGTTTCKKNLVPFSSTNHAPVFDGTKHVYFMERSNKDGNGHRFGRVDVDTWVFEELPQLPGTKFGVVFAGCWHNGAVYAVDADKQLCAFDVAHNTWSRCGVQLPAPHDDVCVRLLSNPHDPTTSLSWCGMVGCTWLTLCRTPCRCSQPRLFHSTCHATLLLLAQTRTRLLLWRRFCRCVARV